MKKATINEKDHTVTIDDRTFKIGEEVTGKLTPEERLLELLEGCVRKHDFKKYPEIASFWFKDGKIIMKERKNGALWVDDKSIWQVFESEYNYNDKEIRGLISNIVEEHFNLMGVTPFLVSTTPNKKWKSISI